MADQKKEDKAPQENGTPESEGQPKETESTDQKVWAELTKGKFKTPEDLAKSYSELEKKFGEQSDEVRQAREFMTVVQPLLKEIQDDPTLFKLLDERLRGKSESDKSEDDKKTDDKPSTDQGDSRQVVGDLLLAKFEERHGIDKMEPEARKELRQQIGDALFELTGKRLGSVDLRKLDSSLENAYIIAKHKSKSEDSDSEDEDRASISSVPASPGKSEKVLTQEEASVAEKMGLTREQYLEGKPS